MTLTVGTDTYISLVNADTYLTNHYMSTDTKLTAWNALSNSDCEVLLRKAAKVIDAQPIAGYKADLTQTMAFPRAVYTDAYKNYPHLTPIIPYLVEDYYVQTEVPADVKYAQCEIAIDLISPSKRKELQREGVKSFSLGSLSENYGSGRDNSLPYEARELLKPYLAGSVPIC
jgi:hypothetical protein